MNISRINAVVLRHSLITFRSFDRILNIFYWPALNIIIWGITSVWLQRQVDKQHLVALILTGLVFWQIVFRVNLETAKGLFEELINHNLVNLFSTPLKFNEWVVALMFLGIPNMILVFACSAFCAWLLYGLNILAVGWLMLPCMISLLISGWWIGFLICSLLINYGLKAQDFIYIIGWVFAPFSSIYYPVDILPLWVQNVAWKLPMTYIFEVMREALNTGIINYSYLSISFILNFIYLIFSILLFKFAFVCSQNKGLARLE